MVSWARPKQLSWTVINMRVLLARDNRRSSHLLNAIVLLQVMSSAKQLDVLDDNRCAATREGQDVVKVEFVGRTALDATTCISLPDRKLHGGRNDPSPDNGARYWLGEVFLPFNCLKSELEN